VKRANRDPTSVLADGDALDRAIMTAQRRVILRHRQLWIPVAIWRDGGVVEVSADTIELPGEDASRPESD
jgi:hypothetical protein